MQYHTIWVETSCYLLLKTKPNLRESLTASTTCVNRADQKQSAHYFTSILINRGVQKSNTDVILYSLAFSQLKHPTQTLPRRITTLSNLPILQKPATAGRETGKPTCREILPA